MPRLRSRQTTLLVHRFPLGMPSRPVSSTRALRAGTRAKVARPARATVTPELTLLARSFVEDGIAMDMASALEIVCNFDNGFIEDDNGTL